jgi:hypothetical protein
LNYVKVNAPKPLNSRGLSRVSALASIAVFQEWRMRPIYPSEHLSIYQAPRREADPLWHRCCIRSSASISPSARYIIHAYEYRTTYMRLVSASCGWALPLPLVSDHHTARDCLKPTRGHLVVDEWAVCLLFSSPCLPLFTPKSLAKFISDMASITRRPQ